MEISQTAIGLLYLYGTLLGASLGLFYDLLRVTRIFLGVHYSRSVSGRLQTIKLPLLPPYREHEESQALGVVVLIEDLLFSILCGISLILLFYECNDGMIRFPVFFAFFAGFFLYRMTLGRLVMLVSEFAAFLIESAVRYVWYFLSYPFRMAGKFLCHLGKQFARKMRSDLLHRLRVRYDRSELRKLEQGYGMFPGPLKQKRGKTNENRKKDPVQPFHGVKDLSRDPRPAFDRRIRNKRHEVQPASGRRA